MAPGTVYMAPANYHLLVERNGTLAFATGQLVNFACPSIDVLFESAADAYGPAVIGVVLTGASSDGSLGLKRIKERGGLAIVQDPADAEAEIMPRSALAIVRADHMLPLSKIAGLLCRLAGCDRPDGSEEKQVARATGRTR